MKHVPNILLIEPDLPLGKIYSRALRQRGYAVMHCYNSQDGIHAADKNRPVVVILELEMATHNGIEFLYEFRSYPEWWDIPVIIFSNVPPSTEALNPASWGHLKIAAYLYKPTTKLSKLLNTVEQVLLNRVGVKQTP